MTEPHVERHLVVRSAMKCVLVLRTTVLRTNGTVLSKIGHKSYIRYRTVVVSLGFGASLTAYLGDHEFPFRKRFDRFDTTILDTYLNYLA